MLVLFCVVVCPFGHWGLLSKQANKVSKLIINYKFILLYYFIIIILIIILYYYIIYDYYIFYYIY
jgi:hypothetical protein